MNLSGCQVSRLGYKYRIWRERMDTTTQDYANYQYRRIVPSRFQKRSGVSTHDFLVRTPWHRPYQFAELPDGTIRNFDSSAFCRIEYDGELTPMLVRRSQTPRLYEATLFVGSLLSESRRVQKYLTIHKAYECLELDRDHTLSAVRHSIAHAEIALTRPNTVNALKSLFGSTKIDFNSHSHVRVYYEQLGRLMIRVDQLLHKFLSENIDQTYAVPEDIELLLDCCVNVAPETVLAV